jgi:hypothetical protein
LPVLVAGFLLAVASPARAAGPAAADLFPADTLAYVEVRESAKVGAQVTAALAGSPLEDVVKMMDARRDGAKTARDLADKPQLAVLGLLASPEVVAEFGKLGGVAAGLTGFSAGGEPEVAVAVLTGDSAAAGLAARAFLSLAQVRRVAAVDGVPVYQFRHPRFSFDPNTGQQKFENDKAPEEGAYEATAAWTPGLFVFGTSKAAVGAVVTRFRGKGGPALGGVAGFRAAQEANPHPGLFVYADAAAVVARLDETRRAGDGGPEPDVVGWFRLLANDKAVRYVAGTVRFRDGGIAAELSAVFAPDRESPLLALLSGPALKPELLGHAPASAGFTVTVGLPEKGRAGAVIGILDAAAKASGALGRSPGEVVKNLEDRFKTPVADGLIGKTRAVTVFVPRRPSAGKEMPTAMALVLHAETPDVAAAWEEFLPRLAADVAGGEPVQPSSEVIDGVKVLSLPGADLPWKAAIHYARKGEIVAVGFDRAVVVAATTAGPAPAPSAADTAAARGTIRAADLLRGLTADAPATASVVPLPPLPPGSGLPRRGFGRQPVGDEIPAETQQKTEEKAVGAVRSALDGLPAGIVTARREGNALRIELVQPAGKNGFAPVIAAVVGWYDAYLDRNPNSPSGYRGGYR